MLKMRKPMSCSLCKDHNTDYESESFAVSSAARDARKGRSRLTTFFQEALEGSTIHGVRYIGSNKFHPIERLVWAIVTLTSLGFGVHLVARLYNKYNSSPLITSFQHEETSVSQLPFPAITICNVNLLKRTVMTNLFQQLEDDIRKARAQGKDPTFVPEILAAGAHLDHLSQYCLTAPSFRRFINETLEDAYGGPDIGKLVSDSFEKAFDENVTDRIHQVKTGDWWKAEREIFKNASINCKDMLLECTWSGEITRCTDIFFSIETKQGKCCQFNAMPKFLLQRMQLDKEKLKREKERLPVKVYNAWKNYVKGDLIIRNLSHIPEIIYPKHQRAGGKPYGLSVLATPELEEYSTCTSNDGSGFKIVAHPPLSAPTITNFGAAIPANAEVFVDIEPRVTVADMDVLKDIDLNLRGCYLPTDEQTKLQFFNFYSVENCVLECHAYHTYKNCSCMRYSMPRNSSHRICGATRRLCVDEVEHNLTQGIGKSSFCSHCLPSCTEIEYKLQISHFDKRESTGASHYQYVTSNGQTRNSTDFSIIHIFMGTDSIYAKERKTLFTTFDLIANAGGLLGLTLGMSIISFIEIAYFLTLRAWFQLRGNVNSESTARKESKSDQ